VQRYGRVDEEEEDAEPRDQYQDKKGSCMDTVVTSTPPLFPAAQAVLDYIRAHDGVTYAELEKVLAPYIQVVGTGSIAMGDFANVTLWGGVSRTFVDTLNEVRCTQLVCRQPVSVMSYLLDGTSLTLPLAKRLRAYAKPHWLPVCFRPIERCEGQKRRSQHSRTRRKGQAGIAPRTRANA
jgi:hypothetical protein